MEMEIDNRFAVKFCGKLNRESVIETTEEQYLLN